MAPTRRRPAGQAGFTLIELMVSLAVASIAVGFIFRVYATSSVVYRSQSQVAELQQSLRTAKQTLAKDLRLAGYYAGVMNTSINTGTGGQGAIDPDEPSGYAPVPSSVYMFSPISIVNSATGPDELRIIYADTSCMAHVTTNGPNYTAASTKVDSTSCFADGDVVMAVRTKDGANSKKGWGCVIKLTGVNNSSGHLNHNPGGGEPYNQPGNAQCDNISQDWNDGFTVFAKFSAKGYRIKPNDARGVLQVSATAGSLDDWQDLAFGFVDMQFAAQVYEPDDLVDSDGLNGPLYDWYSGANLTTLSLSGGKDVLQVRMSLIARTVAEVEGAGTRTTPSLLGDPSKPDNNPVGDRPAVDLSTITNTSSPYYGNYSYRMVTTVVDLRNLGIGRQL